MDMKDRDTLDQCRDWRKEERQGHHRGQDRLQDILLGQLDPEGIQVGGQRRRGGRQELGGTSGGRLEGSQKRWGCLRRWRGEEMMRRGEKMRRRDEEKMTWNFEEEWETHQVWKLGLEMQRESY